MDNFLLVDLNGLPSGKSSFEGRLGREFFAEFGNGEILDADVDVRVTVEKGGSRIDVDMSLDGNVTVECDRCLEDLVLPVSRTVLLEVKFSDGGAQEQQEGERETMYLTGDDTVLDLRQTAYDYVCLSLPLQRHHEEGGCSPEVLKHIRGLADDAADGSAGKEVSDSPFAALAGMFGKE